MALIWNADIFKRAGLDPDKPPATWDDVVTYSKQIHDKLGIAGYGLVARKNAGNTPYRFMPQLWGYGGGVFDEADPSPTYGEIRLNSEASKRALQASYDMYVRDKSVPVSALTNQQADNQPPVPRRPARHDDLAPVRLQRHARPAEEGHGRRQGQGADRHRQHALRPDPDRPGRQARGGVRRLQHPHPEARICRRRQGGRAGGQGASSASGRARNGR